MAYNLLNTIDNINISNCCIYDTKEAFSSDFSTNGDVDGWDVYYNIHTYGCWNGFLFGTITDNDAYISSLSGFVPFSADVFGFIKVSMCVNSVDYNRTARISWITTANGLWDSYKQKDFSIIADGNWHTYIININELQWWQGEVRNLRLYPIYDGEVEDTFFISKIKIYSDSMYICSNPSCDYHNSYIHPCVGIGSRGVCTSENTLNTTFTVIENVNDKLYLNIDGYGYETITIPPFIAVTGKKLAVELNKSISALNVGGYCDSKVQFNETNNSFNVFSGTYSNDSSVAISYSSNFTTVSGAMLLGFINSALQDTSISESGINPASGFRPTSSFRLNYKQLSQLLDSSVSNGIELDPNLYSIEGGRGDWLNSGIGVATTIDGPITQAGANKFYRNYIKIDNYGKTIIDFNHPFNNSGRVSKFYVACSTVSYNNDGSPIYYTNSSIKVVRPLKNGNFKVIFTINIPTYGETAGKLYSNNQEITEIDCDIFVSKGDFIGVYNADIYMGKNLFGLVDATYFQLDGDIIGEFNPGMTHGDGVSGLLLYGRSSYKQNRLSIEIDLNNRYNVDKLLVYGESNASHLEYNIARCLDVNWQVDLFNETHQTGYYDVWNSIWNTYEHNNIAYGIDKLQDGIYYNVDGEAGDSYVSTDVGGVVVTNPHYFFVNGDGEWVDTVQHIGEYKASPFVRGFDFDPIALYIIFPNNSNKTIFKSRIFFKESNNFRNFALSTYLGPYDFSGNADIDTFQLIPSYEAIIVDGINYNINSDLYSEVSYYLFSNPTVATPLIEWSSGMVLDGSGTITNYESNKQAATIDWSVLSHQFNPTICKGFRIYCSYHRSTKINEIELFAYQDGVSSNLSGGVSVYFSAYGDLWNISDIYQQDSTIEVNINNAPRYVNIDIEPMSITTLKNIQITLKTSDLFIGNKGCEYEVLLPSCKTGLVNESKQINITNVYNGVYNLYVDIAKCSYLNNAPIFYSKLNNGDSLISPDIGPPILYYKNDNYPIINRNGNCAINCDCFALKNSCLNKPIYVSYSDKVTWDLYTDNYDGSGLSISNIPTGAITRIKIPVISRSIYWKFGFISSLQLINATEVKFLYEGLELSGACFHDKDIVYEGSVSDTAPHLNNDSVFGSYYTLSYNNYITCKLSASNPVDEIVIYHTYNSNFDMGIDKYVVLYLPCNGYDLSTSIVDYSYLENNIINTGTYITTSGTKGDAFGNRALYFDGDSYLSAPYILNYNVVSNYFTVDFNVKFESFPATGSRIALLKSWSGVLPTIEESGTSTDSWAIVLENTGSQLNLQFWANIISGSSSVIKKLCYVNNISIILNTWYHLSFCRGAAGALSNFTIHSNGIVKAAFSGGFINGAFVNGYQPILIGENFNGLMDEIRISSAPSSEAARYTLSSFVPQSIPYERAYTFSIYNSDNGITFGKYCDVDTYSSNSYSYYDSNSVFNYRYFSYLAIDLGARYDLDVVRVFGDSNTFNSLVDGAIVYSNSNTSNIEEVVFTSTVSDARWVCFNIQNGYSSTITIDKIGIYSNINTKVGPAGGYYNNEWLSIGNSITNYRDPVNLSLNATISGSSYFGRMKYLNLNDGYIGDTLNTCWGSDSESSQWLLFDLGNEYKISKIKLYHGYNDGDTSNLITNYIISTSLSGVVFDEMFDISGNTSFERLHESDLYFSARYVKIDITGYNKTNRYIPELLDFGLFSGATLREVEIYEYYNYSIISSEDYPIICINVGYPFNFNSHSILNPYSDDALGWSNDNSAFSFSDSLFNVPEKIKFESWGTISATERWVALKMNSATNYNNGPHYIQHVMMMSGTTINPCEYSKWWNSNVSILQEDYDNRLSDTISLTSRSLKILYPASTEEEHIYFVGGDTFGIDTLASWRDGINFYIYIDNIDNIDQTYGYFYINNMLYGDYFVEYRWYLSTLITSWSLGSGWNTVFFRFKSADEVIYTNKNVNDNYSKPNTIEIKRIGFIFKGVGNALQINIDGFRIKRNIFEDSGKFDQGLYITNDERIEFKLSTLSLYRGTISFWLRPDYDVFGVDYYRTFKFRNLFYISNNNNDIIGITTFINGIGIYSGNINTGVSITIINIHDWEMDSLMHIGFVYSFDGSDIDSDGSTMRLYFDNTLVGKVTDTWTVSDDRGTELHFGGKGVVGFREDSGYPSSSIDGVLSELKVYNYCKTDFSDIYSTSSTYSNPSKSEDLIEVSSDNVTFYKVDASALPLTFSGISANEIVPVYVRSIIPNNAFNIKNRTSNLLIYWDIAV